MSIEASEICIGGTLFRNEEYGEPVLPHAIANRLAKQALEHIPPVGLVDALKTHERLLKSFGRRLGYLHDSPAALKIAQAWFEDDKWLSDARRLNELGIALFLNVAPLCPSTALDVMEKAATGEGAAEFLTSDIIRHQRWIWLLRALAYEPLLFDRSVPLLARLCAANAGIGHSDNSRSNFEEVFYVVLSGTKAEPEQRISLIRSLLSESDATIRELAFVGLDGMLKTSNFTSGHDFSFQAYTRDLGGIQGRVKTLSDGMGAYWAWCFQPV